MFTNCMCLDELHLCNSNLPPSSLQQFYSSSVKYLLREELFFSKSSEMDEVLIFILFLLAGYSLSNTLMP